MRVIQNLHKEPCFSEREGWTLKQWEGFQIMKRKTGGKAVEPLEWVPHLRWYLQHRDGHVITCKPKAWMDTGGFAMYIDTVLGPWRQPQKNSSDDRMLLVCDNASVHTADDLILFWINTASFCDFFHQT